MPVILTTVILDQRYSENGSRNNFNTNHTCNVARPWKELRIMVVQPFTNYANGPFKEICVYKVKFPMSDTLDFLTRNILEKSTLLMKRFFICVWFVLCHVDAYLTYLLKKHESSLTTRQGTRNTSSVSRFTLRTLAGTPRVERQLDVLSDFTNACNMQNELWMK